MKVLLIFGLACVASVRGSPISNVNCDINTFNTCTDTFAKELGLPEMPTDANVVVEQIGKLVAEQGLDGQKRVCKAMSDLKSCLGDQYSSCISMSFLESIGESASDSAVFVVMGGQEDYLCTTGWDAFVQNWPCIYDVASKQYATLAKCQTDYAASMAKAPVYACKYNQKLSDCYTAPFKQSCAPDAASVLCNSIKAGYDQVFTDCLMTC